MKALVIALLSVLTLAILPERPAQAHRPPYASSRISVGFGFGYPWYRPWPGYYGAPYVGVNVWPQPRAKRTRERAAESGVRQLYVYPAAGQSEERLASDRYECHVWSVEQTDFDPTLGAGSRDEAESYARAISACLEARDYVVR
ncbi:MAG: hypothetical protein PVG24_02500 [Gammaproteobacteria bacterium]|jgi:hypothetical protein